jgi:hypothetical protein
MNNKSDDIFKAKYTEARNANFKGNPFFEGIPTYEVAYKNLLGLFHKLAITEEDKNSPINFRKQILNDIEEEIFLTNKILKLFDMTYELITNGYRNRNPLSKEYLMELNQLGEDYRDKANKTDYLQCSGYAEGMSKVLSMFGVTGMGKSRTIQKILRSIPSYIIHENYQGKPFMHLQIPYVYIRCPEDCSLTTICFDFFSAIDLVAGTNFRAKFGYTTKDVSGIINRMRAIGAMYGVGLFCIDELQDIIDSGKDTAEVKTFLSQLANMVGFPIMLIGTVNSYDLFTTGSSQRRAVSGGEIQWDSMKNGDNDWVEFLVDLWDLQVLKNYTELTKELNDALYDASQGITDFVKKIFLGAQRLSMEIGEERLTVEIIKEALELYPTINRITTAIKNDDTIELSKMGDVIMRRDIFIKDTIGNKDYFEKLNDKMLDIFKNREIFAGGVTEEIIDFVRKNKLARRFSDIDLENMIKPIVFRNKDEELEIIIRKAIVKINEEDEKKKQSIKNKTKPAKEGLIKLINEVDPKNSGYNALIKGGYIKENLK